MATAVYTSVTCIRLHDAQLCLQPILYGSRLTLQASFRYALGWSPLSCHTRPSRSGHWVARRSGVLLTRTALCVEWDSFTHCVLGVAPVGCLLHRLLSHPTPHAHDLLWLTDAVGQEEQIVSLHSASLCDTRLHFGSSGASAPLVPSMVGVTRLRCHPPALLVLLDELAVRVPLGS